MPHARTEPSKRTRIRDAAERILEERREPMHISDLAPLVWAAVGLPPPVSTKTVGVAMHDDSKRRFANIPMGTWTLKKFRR